MSREEKSYRRARLREIIGILKRNDLQHGITPEKLVQVIEDLGPTYIKLGQILAMRQDILPPEYCQALLKLQVDVRPMPFAEVLSVLEQEYHTNPMHIFSYIDPIPLGSASIAQVHRAVFQSDGKSAVIKVQRPGIYEKMAEDVSLLTRAAKIASVVSSISDVVDFQMIIREMWAAAQKEMDFLIEAKNAERFYHLNQDVVYVTSPYIFEEYTTSKVLAMSFIGGFDLSHKKDIEKEGYDLKDIATKLCHNYMKQILTDGFFQADPHYGNIHITDGKIGYIDMGMMGEISKRDQALLSQAIEAIAMGNVESLKAAFLSLGQVKGRIDHSALYISISALLDEYTSMDLQDIDIAVFVEQILGICSTHHIAMPKGITMLCRGIITLEGVVLDLDPTISPIRLFMDYVIHQKSEQFDFQSESKKLARKLLSAGVASVDLPLTLQELLSSMLKGQTKVNIALTGSEEPLAAVSRMVNKIVMCIILASCIIGSSFLATTNTEPKILGIPVLGFLGFVLSFMIGLVIVIEMYRQQKKLDGH